MEHPSFHRKKNNRVENVRVRVWISECLIERGKERESKRERERERERERRHRLLAEAIVVWAATDLFMFPT